MRIGIVLMSMFALQALAACSEVQQNAALKDAGHCARDVTASHEATLVFNRLWTGDGTDTPDKLRDTTPLTPEEQDALMRYRYSMLQCRQKIEITSMDLPAADPADRQYRDAFFQRTDAIMQKVQSGEITVGMANRLSVESNGVFLADLQRVNPKAVPRGRQQIQHQAEAMLQDYEQAAAAEAAQRRAEEEADARQRKSKQGKSKQAQSAPTAATTNCAWSGNALNCIQVR